MKKQVWLLHILMSLVFVSTPIFGCVDSFTKDTSETIACESYLVCRPMSVVVTKKSTLDTSYGFSTIVDPLFETRSGWWQRVIVPSVFRGQFLIESRRMIERKEILFVEPNHAVHACFDLNDPLLVHRGSYAFTSSLHRIPEMRDLISRTSDRVILSVVDSGVDSTHSDLGYSMPKPSDSYTAWNGSSGGDTTDFFGHGTFVSGIMFGLGNNGYGAAGVSVSSRGMPIRVLDNNGYGNYDVLGAGIVHGVDMARRNSESRFIFNFSFGTNEFSQFLYDSCELLAHLPNTLVVCAAGNSHAPVDYFFPAQWSRIWKNFISVGSIDSDGGLSYYSNLGADIAAAGSHFLGAFPLNKRVGPISGYKEDWSGTSFASPMVAGVSGLVWSRFPELTGEGVKNRILATAKISDLVSSTQVLGSRVLDGFAAVSATLIAPVAAARVIGVVHEGSVMTIDCSGSTDSLGRSLLYTLHFSDGTPDVTSTNPVLTHVVPVTGTLTPVERTISVIVSNGESVSTPCVVSFTVLPEKAPPQLFIVGGNDIYVAGVDNLAISFAISSPSQTFPVEATFSWGENNFSQTITVVKDSLFTFTHTYQSGGPFVISAKGVIQQDDGHVLSSTVTQTVYVIDTMVVAGVYTKAYRSLLLTCSQQLPPSTSAIVEVIESRSETAIGTFSLSAQQPLAYLQIRSLKKGSYLRVRVGGRVISKIPIQIR